MPSPISEPREFLSYSDANGIRYAASSFKENKFEQAFKCLLEGCEIEEVERGKKKIIEVTGSIKGQKDGVNSDTYLIPDEQKKDFNDRVNNLEKLTKDLQAKFDPNNDKCKAALKDLIGLHERHGTAIENISTYAVANDKFSKGLVKKHEVDDRNEIEGRADITQVNNLSAKLEQTINDLPAPKAAAPAKSTSLFDRMKNWLSKPDPQPTSAQDSAEIPPQTRKRSNTIAEQPISAQMQNFHHETSIAEGLVGSGLVDHQEVVQRVEESAKKQLDNLKTTSSKALEVMGGQDESSPKVRVDKNLEEAPVTTRSRSSGFDPQRFAQENSSQLTSTPKPVLNAASKDTSKGQGR